MSGPEVKKSSQKAGPIPRGNTWVDKGIAGYRARKETEAAEAKNMATLIAQLAQVGMVKPAKKAGVNTLSAYGKHFEIVNKEPDRASIRQQQIIDAERKSIGELPMSDFEMGMQARDEALKFFNDPNWELREMAIRDEIKDPVKAEQAIAEAKADVIEQSYQSLVGLQKQFFPEHYAKNPAPAHAPDIDVNTGEVKEKQSIPSWKDIGSKMLNSIIAPDEGAKPKPATEGFDMSMLNPLAAKTAYADEGTPTKQKGSPRTFKSDMAAVPPWMKYGAMGGGLAGGINFHNAIGGMAGWGRALGHVGSGAGHILGPTMKGGGLVAKYGLTHLPHAAAIGLAGAAGWGAGRQIGRTNIGGKTIDARVQQAMLNMLKTSVPGGSEAANRSAVEAYQAKYPGAGQPINPGY